MAEWVEAGQEAPAFTLPDQDGTLVSLTDYRGRYVVLYFYPKDDTPGCASQACQFRDSTAEFDVLGAAVLGVSGDDAVSHRAFRAKYALPFPLLTDEEHRVATAYGAYREINRYGKTAMGVQRSTFVIGPDGVVVRAWKRVQVERHLPSVLVTVEEHRAARFGGG